MIVSGAYDRLPLRGHISRYIPARPNRIKKAKIVQVQSAPRAQSGTISDLTDSTRDQSQSRACFRG